ncbi:MAG TPA: aldehyde dehydrogenase family protein [Gemmatimonadaceae bacterium]
MAQSIPHFRSFVSGAASSSGDATVFSPYDRSPIATFAVADAAVIETALMTASALFRDKSRWLEPGDRIAVLRKLADRMDDDVEQLAMTIAREGGKPLMDARAEAIRAADSVRGCVDVLRTQHGSEVPMRLNAASSHHMAYTSLEPAGPVVAISAFNHPLNLIVHQVATAIAAGCPVIAKPAERTPMSCFQFAKMLYDAGLPGGWCQVVVPMDHTLSERLATDPRVAFLTFIGSAKVGWMLRSKLPPGTRCALEHGGAAPVIVAEDADVEKMLPMLVKGAFYHAGQVCVSIQRIFAHRSIAKCLADDLADRVKRLRVGDPTSADTEVGPLIAPSEVDRVDQWVREAQAGGATVLCGGKRISDTCYQCTVLYDPPRDARVSTMEVFGPVVCVYPYDDMDEAIDRANALPFAFQSAICTRSLDTALRAFRRLDATAVLVNESTTFRVDWMPFAGRRTSGLGTGGIGYSIRDMQVEKMLVIKSEQL